jgi:hypothetical protein
VPDGSPTVFGGDGEQEMTTVLAVGDGLLALGRNGDDAGAWTWTPDDGWEPVDSSALGGDGSQVINSAAVVSGTEIIAVGNDSPVSGDDTAAAWRSPDGGATWGRLPTAPSFISAGGAHARAVAVGPDGRIVVGGLEDASGDSSAVIWTTLDQENWTRYPETPGGDPFGGADGLEIATITTGPNGYVAVGEEKEEGAFDAVVWTSPDGTAWERSTSPALSGDGDQRLIHVLRTTSGLMAVGYAEEEAQNGAVWVSDDGTDWSRLDVGAFDLGGDEIMRGIACLENRIVVVGRVSDHGAAWTADGATC